MSIEEKRAAEVKRPTLTRLVDACQFELAVSGVEGMTAENLFKRVETSTGFVLLKSPPLLEVLTRELVASSPGITYNKDSKLFKASESFQHEYVGITPEMTAKSKQLLIDIAKRKDNGVQTADLRKAHGLTSNQLSYFINQLLRKQKISRIGISTSGSNYTSKSTFLFLRRFAPVDEDNAEVFLSDLQLLVNLLEQIPGGILPCRDAAAFLRWTPDRLVSFGRMCKVLRTVELTAGEDQEDDVDADGGGAEEIDTRNLAEVPTISTILRVERHSPTVRLLLYPTQGLPVDAVTVLNMLEEPVSHTNGALSALAAQLENPDLDEIDGASDDRDISRWGVITGHSLCFYLVASFAGEHMPDGTWSSFLPVGLPRLMGSNHHYMKACSLVKARVADRAAVPAELTVDQSLLQEAFMCSDAGLSSRDFGSWIGIRSKRSDTLFELASASPLLKSFLLPASRTQSKRLRYGLPTVRGEWDAVKANNALRIAMAEKSGSAPAADLESVLRRTAPEMPIESTESSKAKPESSRATSNTLSLATWLEDHPTDPLRALRCALLLRLLEQVPAFTLLDAWRFIRAVESCLQTNAFACQLVGQTLIDTVTVHKVATELQGRELASVHAFDPRVIQEEIGLPNMPPNPPDRIYVIATLKAGRSSEEVIAALTAYGRQRQQTGCDDDRIDAAADHFASQLLATCPEDLGRPLPRVVGEKAAAGLAEEPQIVKPGDSIFTLLGSRTAKIQILFPSAESGRDNIPATQLSGLRSTDIPMFSSPLLPFSSNIRRLDTHSRKRKRPAADKPRDHGRFEPSPPPKASGGKRETTALVDAPLPHVDVDVPPLPQTLLSFVEQDNGRNFHIVRRSLPWTAEDDWKLVRAAAIDTAWQELVGQRRFEYEMAKYHKYLARRDKDASLPVEREPSVTVRKKDWNRISTALGVDVEVCQRRWRTHVRDAYSSAFLSLLTKKRAELGVTLYTGMDSHPTSAQVAEVVSGTSLVQDYQQLRRRLWDDAPSNSGMVQAVAAVKEQAARHRTGMSIDRELEAFCELLKLVFTRLQLLYTQAEMADDEAWVAQYREAVRCEEELMAVVRKDTRWDDAIRILVKIGIIALKKKNAIRHKLRGRFVGAGRDYDHTGYFQNFLQVIPELVQNDRYEVNSRFINLLLAGPQSFFQLEILKLNGALLLPDGGSDETIVDLEDNLDLMDAVELAQKLAVGHIHIVPSASSRPPATETGERDLSPGVADAPAAKRARHEKRGAAAVNEDGSDASDAEDGQSSGLKAAVDKLQNFLALQGGNILKNDRFLSSVNVQPSTPVDKAVLMDTEVASHADTLDLTALAPYVEKWFAAGGGGGLTLEELHSILLTGEEKIPGLRDYLAAATLKQRTAILHITETIGVSPSSTMVGLLFLGPAHAIAPRMTLTSGKGSSFNPRTWLHPVSGSFDSQFFLLVCSAVCSLVAENYCVSALQIVTHLACLSRYDILVIISWLNAHGILRAFHSSLGSTEHKFSVSLEPGLATVEHLLSELENSAIRRLPSEEDLYVLRPDAFSTWKKMVRVVTDLK